MVLPIFAPTTMERPRGVRRKARSRLAASSAPELLKPMRLRTARICG